MLERESTGLRVLESGDGVPMVLLHAFPLNAELFTYQLKSTFTGFRLIAVDLPGFGGSPYREMHSMDEYADAVLTLLDAEGIDRCVLGGSSMGGYVAFAILRRAPELIRGLVLAGTRAGPDAEQARAGREESARRVEAEGLEGFVEELIGRLLAPATANRQPDVAERVLRMGLDADPRGIASALRAMAGRADATDLLDDIRVPTLIVTGSEDRLAPVAEAEAMHERIPSSRLEVVSGAGHLTPIEAPDAFNTVLRALFDDIT